MFIYTITNICNGKSYVGQTHRNNPNVRWDEHKSVLNKGHYKNNPHLQSSWTKYGKDSFDFEIIDTAQTIKELDSKEDYYITLLDTMNSKKGYNKKSGGTNGNVLSEESRRKLSKSLLGNIPWNKGKHLSDEHRRKVSESHKGMHPSKETCIKMSKSKTGRPLPKATCVKMSISKLGTKHPLFGKHPSVETRRKMSDAHKKRPSIQSAE